MQLKRICAILLVVALIFSVPTVYAGAETVEAIEAFEVGVEAETATPISSSPKIFGVGDEVSVKISVNQNTGISFLRFVIHFNPEALEYVEHISENLFDSSLESIQVKDGSLIYFVALGSEVSEATGDLFSVSFKMKSGYCGDVEIFTKLASDREANCSRYYSSAKNAYVPFVAGSDSFAVHNIDTTNGIVTAPTCTEDGFTTYECSSCKETVIGNTTEKLGHISAEAVEENRIDCTCTKKGSYDTVVYCERCGAELSRNNISVDELGHDLIHHDAKDPTCTENGWDAYDTCIRCDYTTYIEKEALGHNIVHYDSKEPTCTETGLTDGERCSVCGEILVEQQEVPALGHTEVVDSPKAATCTETGLTEGKHCSVCEKVLVEQQEVPALGHVFGEQIIKAPTCIAAGSRYRTCTVCGEKGDATEFTKLDDSSKKFTDIFSTDWYKNAVDYVSTKGLMKGTEETIFEPKATMTRAMLVTVLYRMEGEPEVEGGNPFDDVKEGEWYSDAIAWAAANGIVVGISETSFAPMDEITREQMATILYRYSGEYKKLDVSARADLTSFPDYEEVSSYAEDALAWANSEGIVNGSGVGEKTMLDPKGNATRAQVAALLMRFCLKFL